MSLNFKNYLHLHHIEFLGSPTMAFARIHAYSITETYHLEGFPFVPSIIFWIRAAQETLVDGTEPWAATGWGESDLATSAVQSEGCLRIPSVDSGSGGEMAPPEDLQVLSSRGRERTRQAESDLKALCNPSCQEVINTRLGFLSNSKCLFFELEQSWMGTQGH